MKEIDDLQTEIKVLKKRIEILENNENKRKIAKNINRIIKICAFLLIIFGIYQGYEYVKNNIDYIIENKIKDINILKK